MKQLTYIILILFTLASCRKSDEKIEELIIGEWYAKSTIILGWSTGIYYSNEYEFREGGLLIENGRCTCGCSKDINGNYSTSGDAKCYTEYKIENGEVYILYCVFHQTGLNIDSVSQNWNKIPIKRINENVMVLGGKNGFPEQKYIKQ
jgi:hypothetical protein